MNRRESQRFAFLLPKLTHQALLQGALTDQKQAQTLIGLVAQEGFETPDSRIMISRADLLSRPAAPSLPPRLPTGRPCVEG